MRLNSMIKIACIGDIALSGLITEDAENNINRFSIIAEKLKDFDFVFANLETPIKAGNEVNSYKRVILGAGKEQTKLILNMLNIHCVSLANNHIYDYKRNGLETTINTLEILQIKHTGAGWLSEHLKPVVFERGGRKYAIIAYVSKDTNPKTEIFSELLINYLELEKVKSDILSIRKNVDYIICSIHWGIDYSNFFTEKQQMLAHSLIDLGVDAIIGHHPHAIQAYEVYKEKYIFYSLGQLCFGDFYWEGALKSLKRKTKLGMIPIFDENLHLNNIIPTKELKENFIIVPKMNIKRKLKKIFVINKLKIKFKFISYLIKFKEAIFDRIFEFCFGYYRNPIRQLTQFRTLKKVHFMIRDLKK